MENKEKIENLEIEEIVQDEIDEDDGSDIYDSEKFKDSDVQLKHPWQLAKERQYAKLNVTVEQLDAIIHLCVAGLVIVAILIGLDAAGIF